MIGRNTVQKDIIYSALCRLGNHPTADEVFDCVHADYPRISRTTVYRVLNRMAESGKILKVRVSGGADRFDHTTHPHEHIRCVKCGRVCDIETDGIGDLTGRITDTSGFSVTGFSVEFVGLCPECKKQ